MVQVNDTNFYSLFKKSDRDRFWNGVKTTLIEVFETRDFLADSYRRILEDAPIEEQLLVYHSSFLQIAADLTGTETVSENQLTIYQMRVLNRPIPGKENAIKIILHIANRTSLPISKVEGVLVSFIGNLYTFPTSLTKNVFENVPGVLDFYDLYHPTDPQEAENFYKGSSLLFGHKLIAEVTVVERDVILHAFKQIMDGQPVDEFSENQFDSNHIRWS